MSQIFLKVTARRLHAAMPDRSVFVSAEYGCYGFECEDLVELKVSIIPGLDHSACQLFKFRDTDELNKWVDETIKKHTGE